LMPGASYLPAPSRRHLVDQQNGKRVETTAFRPFLHFEGSLV
jgi:hypothetical protein